MLDSKAPYLKQYLKEGSELEYSKHYAGKTFRCDRFNKWVFYRVTETMKQCSGFDIRIYRP